MILTEYLIECLRPKSTIECCIHCLYLYQNCPLTASPVLEKAYPRHIRTSAYCCFLPDLTRFTGSHCAGPKPTSEAVKGQSSSFFIYSLILAYMRQICQCFLSCTPLLTINHHTYIYGHTDVSHLTFSGWILSSTLYILLRSYFFPMTL